MTPIDSMIFDMDGTLWDAVDTYCRVWDVVFERIGTRRAPVQRHELLGQMGRPLDDIFNVIAAGTDAPRDRFFELLPVVEDEVERAMGGNVYPGVRPTLEELRRRGIRLFMVSNCQPNGLDNFFYTTGLQPFFTDWRTFGGTGFDKDVNIAELARTYSLNRPVYVGDIQRDLDSTHAAGAEFVWAAYGFGTADRPDFTIHTFNQLLQLPIA